MTKTMTETATTCDFPNLLERIEWQCTGRWQAFGPPSDLTEQHKQLLEVLRVTWPAIRFIPQADRQWLYEVIEQSFPPEIDAERGKPLRELRQERVARLKK